MFKVITPFNSFYSNPILNFMLHSRCPHMHRPVVYLLETVLNADALFVQVTPNIRIIAKCIYLKVFIIFAAQSNVFI